MAKVNEFDMYRTLSENVSIDDMREIVKTAVIQAREGNPEARAWLSAYMMGRPHECTLRLSNLDASERMDAASNDMISALYPPKKGKR
jgi:hypothetical protein